VQGIIDADAEADVCFPFLIPVPVQDRIRPLLARW